MSGLRIDVADLLAHPGSRRAVDLAVTLDDLAGSSVRVPGPVAMALDLERIPDGIVVRGDIGCTWAGECSTCLVPLERDLVVHVDELFEADPVEGETYPVEGHEIDLEQVVRDAVLLDLPLAPHCEGPCVDPCVDSPGAGVAEPASTTAPDPRWAVLSDLEIT